MHNASPSNALPRMQPVNSSNIAAVGFNPDDRGTASVLVVQFVNGNTYSYAGVPVDVHAAFLAAASPGKYFLTHIRGKYTFEKVGH